MIIISEFFYRPEKNWHKMSTSASKSKSAKKAPQNRPRQRPVRSRGKPRGVALRDMVGRGFTPLALSMCLPAAYSATRLPTVDMPRTACLTARDQLNVTSPGNAALGYTMGDLLIAFYGQVNRLAHVFTLNPGATIYDIKFPGSSNPWPIANSVVTSGSTEGQSWWPPTKVILNTGAAIHGRVMPLGIGDSIPGMFFNQGDVLYSHAWSQSLTGTVTEFSIDIEIYRWKAFDWVSQNIVRITSVVSGTTADFAAGPLYTHANGAYPGYYAFKVAGINLTGSGSASMLFGLFTTGLQLRTAAATGLTSSAWQLIHMGDLDSNNGGDAAIGEDCRVNAASLLVTNTSALLDRQGTALAARVSTDDVFSVSATSLARLAEKYVGDAAKGVYTFHEFSVLAEQFTNHTNDDLGLTFDLGYDDYVHLIQISNPGYLSKPNSYALSFDTTLEFKTDSSRYSKSVSRLAHGDLIAARAHINSRPEWFYENPEHMKSIYNFIQRAGQFARRAVRFAAPYGAAVMGVADPTHSALYNQLANLAM